MIEHTQFDENSEHAEHPNSLQQRQGDKSQERTRRFLRCPECDGKIRSYFINANDKLFMCSNKKCKYPFGEKHFHELLADKHESEAVGRLLTRKLKQQDILKPPQ